MTVNKFQHSAQLFSRLYSNLPGFTDIFDEETFYITAAAVTIVTLIVTMVLARYVKIKEVEW